MLDTTRSIFGAKKTKIQKAKSVLARTRNILAYFESFFEDNI